MITASIETTEDFVIERLQRYYRTTSRPFLLLLVKIVGISLAGFCLILAFTRGLFIFVILSLVLCIFFCFAEQIEYTKIRRLVKKSHDNPVNFKIDFTETSFHAKSLYSEAEFQWIAFTKVVQFRDGLLLFRGEHIFDWIPFSSLNDPSQAADLEALLRSKIQDYILFYR